MDEGSDEVLHSPPLPQQCLLPPGRSMRNHTIRFSDDDGGLNVW